MNFLRLFLVLYIVFGVIVGVSETAQDLRATQIPATQNQLVQAQPATNQGVATYTGEYVCLPHKDQSGSQDLNCRIGLKADDGSYVALDFGGAPARYVNGDRLEVTGEFVPVETLSADFWRSYPITGILVVRQNTKI